MTLSLIVTVLFPSSYTHTHAHTYHNNKHPHCVGFITMTPQLFINYKLKSVAHLPWRMLTYKALNTFIDDMFAFVIKMPTMYRIGCFRDGELINFIPLLDIIVDNKWSINSLDTSINRKLHRYKLIKLS